MPRAYIGYTQAHSRRPLFPRGDLIMKIQKLFAIALAGSLALALTACGSSEPAAKTDDTAAADTSTDTADTTTDNNTDLGGTDTNTDNTDNTDTNTDTDTDAKH